MSEMGDEQDSTVDPHEGLRILESAKPGVCKAFEGQGDSPASAVESAIIGYQNAVTELDRLHTRNEALESVVADLRQARDEAWDEQERLRTCIAKLEAERDQMYALVETAYKQGSGQDCVLPLGEVCPECSCGLKTALTRTDTEDK